MCFFTITSTWVCGSSAISCLMKLYRSRVWRACLTNCLSLTNKSCDIPRRQMYISDLRPQCCCSRTNGVTYHGRPCRECDLVHTQTPVPEKNHTLNSLRRPAWPRSGDFPESKIHRLAARRHAKMLFIPRHSRRCPLTTPCCRFPHGKGWTAVDPKPSFRDPPLHYGRAGPCRRGKRTPPYAWNMGLLPIVKRSPATLTQSSICEFSAHSTLGAPYGICDKKKGASAKIGYAGPTSPGRDSEKSR